MKIVACKVATPTIFRVSIVENFTALVYHSNELRYLKKLTQITT
jgi:hypothetical protein